MLTNVLTFFFVEPLNQIIKTDTILMCNIRQDNRTENLFYFISLIIYKAPFSYDIGERLKYSIYTQEKFY